MANLAAIQARNPNFKVTGLFWNGVSFVPEGKTDLLAGNIQSNGSNITKEELRKSFVDQYGFEPEKKDLIDHHRFLLGRTKTISTDSDANGTENSRSTTNYR